jgi:hypothetical protein
MAALRRSFEKIGSMFDRKAECGLGDYLRPYDSIFRRLFAIAPRPLTLKQQVDMLNFCLAGCFFGQVQALYANSKEETKALRSTPSCCDDASECEYAR